MIRMTRLLTAIFIFSSILLQACQSNMGQGPSFSNKNYAHYRKQMRMQDDVAGGPPGYSKPVSVPYSPQFAGRSTPKSHKERDLEWINGQNPSSYTIEITSDEKAAAVANSLYEIPKEERMGQFKHKQNGKTVHTGVYGSFSSQEEAEKALSQLPESARTKAQVKQWNNLQSEANEAAVSEFFADDSLEGNLPPPRSNSDGEIAFPEISVEP